MFYVFLHVNTRKYDIILPGVDQIHKKSWICSNLVRVPEDPQLQQNSHGIWASWHYSSKSSRQNILLGSLGTQHQAASAIWCLFLKKHTRFLNQTLTLKCLPWKSFFLVKWAFPFVDPQGPFSCSKAAKRFYAYEGYIS